MNQTVPRVGAAEDLTEELSLDEIGTNVFEYCTVRCRICIGDANKSFEEATYLDCTAVIAM